MCRKHVKTRADQTEKHTFSRSRYTAFSRSRAAGGLGSEARQGGFHGRPQRSDRRIQRRGDARVHERNREIASAVQQQREEGDGTQEVLPRTTTTLVVLKASGTTLW